MASLQDKYNAFLANPTTDYLAPKASLHYIPTLTTLNEPIGILKHLNTQQQCVTKKSEKILNAFESCDSLCLETETTLQFMLSGGTYLPGLDDNFINDKVVTAAILHIVTFDADQKILQIRLHWDQASLLKDVETIGARGRNWPINSGKDQTLLVAQSAAAAPHNAGASPESVIEERTGRPQSRGVDPHSSLALFAPREITAREESPRNLVAPRDSAKPAMREWTELFANGQQPAADGARSPSPSKLDNPIKSGAGKHYKDIRLFSPENEDLSEEKGIKTDAKKYNHFEFGEAEFKPSPVKNDRKKHMSQWDFADFVTPVKPKQRATAFPSRNFEFNDTYGEGEAAVKPLVWAQHVPHARPDASAHFDFNEDATPTLEEKERPMIARNEKSAGLYQDHILGDDSRVPGSSSGEQAIIARNEKSIGLYEDHVLGLDTRVKGTSSSEPEKLPLGNITNTTASNPHRATFDSSWEMKDEASPAPAGIENQTSKTAAETQQKTVRNTQPGWAMFDKSPSDAQQGRGIKILGNGSGSARTAARGLWDY